MIDTDKYEKILATEDIGEKLLYDAVENLLTEVKRLRKAIEKWEDEWCKLGDYISHYDNKMYEAIDEDIGWAE
jgi:hemoglobin-like flavoprotein